MDPKTSPLYKWWIHLPRSSQVSILVTSLLLLIAIPLSIHSALNEVNVAPNASSDVSGLEGSRQNLLLGQTDTIIECALNTDCVVNFTGESPHANSALSMDIDFLPANLRPSRCLTSADTSVNKITCGFEGTPQKTGRYKIQITLNDSQGSQKRDVYTLQVR